MPDAKKEDRSGKAVEKIFGMGETDWLEALKDQYHPEMSAPDMSRPVMWTPWGEKLDPENVLEEYPRPQMVRDSYINLNGYWECAFTDGEKQPEKWQRILVPFSPEAPLSGVKRVLKPSETLWYRRSLPDIEPEGQRILLHFMAVDQEAEVLLNGRAVGHHRGGYTPFEMDVTDAWNRSGNELLVKVKDDTDASWHSRGKQKLECGGVYYTPQSGIWQTVWMEQVPENYITGLHMTPLYDEKKLELTVMSSVPVGTCSVKIKEKVLELETNRPQRIDVTGMKEWTPENPCLHELIVTFGADHVKSYFALRKTEVREDQDGVRKLFLNNRPYFHTGLLDQGYYPDGLYTAPSDEAMIFDIQAAKDMGFNMLRKHVKVEPLRWYYHCDRLGILVWQDMVSGGRWGEPEAVYGPMFTGNHLKDDQYGLFGRQDAESREEYYRELEEVVALLYNSPSVVMWVPFNEGWGQFDAAKAVEKIRQLDTTRTIDHASGWNDQKIGDFKSSHDYRKDFCMEKDDLGRAVILTEFGGLTCQVKDHTFDGKVFGYTAYETTEELQKGMEEIFGERLLTAKSEGLAASVYTQLTDVELELNGLITYDRKLFKVPAERMAALNGKLKEQ